MDYDGVRLFEVQRTFMGDVPLLRAISPSLGYFSMGWVVRDFIATVRLAISLAH
jgi:hypothetical protein